MKSDDQSPVPSRVLTTANPLTRPTQEAGTGAPETDDGETHSPAMRELFVKAQRVARTELTILVTGETGAGKE
jgi:DNA-binding NtrC family response regulator